MPGLNKTYQNLFKVGKRRKTNETRLFLKMWVSYKRFEHHYTKIPTTNIRKKNGINYNAGNSLESNCKKQKIVNHFPLQKQRMKAKKLKWNLWN